MNIAKRIVNLREKKGYSTTKLAKTAGIAQSTLRDIEQGNTSPTWDTIKKISNALGLSPYALLTPENNKDLLSSDMQQVVNKIRKLSPHKLKVLNEVLDTWIEDTEENRLIPEKLEDSKTINDLEKRNSYVNYLCQLLDANIVVPIIKGRPLTKEEKEGFIKFIKKSPYLLPDDDFGFFPNFAAHDEGKEKSILKPELVKEINASQIILSMLEKYLENKDQQ